MILLNSFSARFGYRFLPLFFRMDRPVKSIRLVVAALCCVMGPAMDSFAQDGKLKDAAIRLPNCRIKPEGQVTLSANQSGILTSVPKEGDQVEAGQQVIQLDSELARTAVAVAERQAEIDVDIRFAEISSDVARLEYEQAKDVNMSSPGSIPLTEVRRRKLEYDRSLLQIEQSKHQQAVALLKLNEANAQLKTFSVAAPFAGTVTKVVKKAGESVRPGEPVLELVNTRRVRVEGYIDAALRRRISAGTPVQVEGEKLDDEVPRPASGKIVFVDTVVQPVTRQIRIFAEVDNSDESLVAGLTATMTVLPTSAVAGSQ